MKRAVKEEWGDKKLQHIVEEASKEGLEGEVLLEKAHEK